jgi:hypothetical protein
MMLIPNRDMSKGNPFPAESFVVLALLAALLFVPRMIERTDTTCAAVSSQVVDMMMAHVTEPEMTRLMTEVPDNLSIKVAREFVQAGLRHAFASKIEPKLGLADKPWYQCSVLYWVNLVNPLPAQ